MDAEETNEIKSLNNIDTAISNCSEKIKEHKKQANFFLTFLFLLISLFIIMLFTFFTKDKFGETKIEIFDSSIKNNIDAYKLHNRTKDLINSKINKTNYLIETVNNIEESKNIDSLFWYIKEESNLMKDFREDLNDVIFSIDTSFFTTKKIARNIREQTTLSNDLDINIFYYLLYGLFIFIIGVIISFYKYHLKEISKLEHYYFGFMRIRIAGNNSKTGFDDLVKESLTHDAFVLNLSKRSVSSPIPGHPGSDLSTNLINKLLDKFELKQKK